MKYKTIGAFKGVQNVPDCKAATELKVGMGVVLDRARKTAALPDTEEKAKACHYIVTNIHDNELAEAGVVAEGDFVRADDLTSVANLEISFGSEEVTGYSTIAVNDKLVFGTDGLLKVAADTTGYAVYFEVIALTAYQGSGLLAVIRVQ